MFSVDPSSLLSFLYPSLLSLVGTGSVAEMVTSHWQSQVLSAEELPKSIIEINHCIDNHVGEVIEEVTGINQ
ncbi:hypothetical protein L484_007575 [Morus notabilis]|uniref:Uncharacterized protein n=1 Tax=Morus notabilis TaxID=981085 RepID=W9QM69_9ROSA|nr:hypothetical protein L484_007575 [Morus notabilis]